MSPLLTGLLVLLAAPLAGGLLTGADRIVSARLQGRVGPPLLQPFFDVGKLLSKAPRSVNPLAGPLLLGHLGLMALTLVLLVTGTDLLFIAFLFALASLLLPLAAGTADSPYSTAGAERELLGLLASEPLLILMLAVVCKVTGESTFAGVLASPVPVAARAPGVLAAFLLLAVLKLRKSPFDLAASHHAHQELVRGLTSDFSGALLARVEVAHWIETALLFALFQLFFNWSVWLGLGAALVVFAGCILVDNSTARVRWQLMLRTTWTATAVLGGGNLVVLFLRGP